MSYDQLELAAVPVAEECEQLGDGYDPVRARAECQAFIHQLRRQFGPEEGSARLRVASNAHDFGTYYDVAVRWREGDEEGCEYAFRLEGELPERWDDAARAELGLASV